jgi:hypothetical protein
MTLTATFCFFLKDTAKQLDQDEIIGILDQANDPEWHETIVNDINQNFEMSQEEFVSYFKGLENLEKIKRTNGPGTVALSVDY